MNKTSSIIFVLCFLNLSVFAFRPIGHVILKDSIVKSLPKDNRFRIAMEKHPQIASWGAVGPDLAYNVDFSRTFQSRWKRQMKNSMQLADVAHYHAVGTFLNALIREADSLIKKDSVEGNKLYAFIGGWITHIAGDFGSHGVYVKPEAGYYIAFEGGRDIHSDLEKISDAYLYKKYAHKYCLSGWDFNAAHYWEKFFGLKPAPKHANEKMENMRRLKDMFGCVEQYFVKAYKETYGISCVSFNLKELAFTYYRSVGEGLGAYAGFEQYTVIEAAERILKSGRQTKIDSAFSFALGYGKKLLSNAVLPDKGFSDAWNLDIGENGEPTYIIRLDAARSLYSRTKNDIYITFKKDDGKESAPILITTKIGPMKFAFYQKDDCFYAVNPGGAEGELRCWRLENVVSATLSMRPRKMQLFANVFRMERAIIYYNGKAVSQLPDSTNGKRIKLKVRSPLTFTLKNG